MYAFEILFFVLSFLLLTFLIVFKRDYGRYWEKRGVKFEKPIPLIGNVLEVILFRKNIGILSRDIYFKYLSERFFGIWILTEPTLVVRCPDLIKEILVKDFDYFSNRNVPCNEDVDPLAANMMFFMKNPKWRLIRSKTTPLFSSGKIKYIGPQIQTIANNMASYIASRNNKAFNIEDICNKYSTEVICSSAFGICADSLQDKDTPFAMVGKDIFRVSLRNTIAAAIYFCQSPLEYIFNIFKIKFIKSTSAKFLSETFLNMLKQRELTESDRKDLLNVMIDFKNELKLSNDELVAQAAQFFVAGYETTSIILSFSLYEISSNKHIQDRLRYEINDCKDDEGNISYSSLKEMTYLDKVVSECFRKYPPLPFLGRTCTKDYKIPQTDIVIEKGVSTIIPLMGLHYDPQYFPNPEEFDPERFSEENIRARHSYSYLPFGDGQRNCIGKRIGLISVKLALFHIIKNFEMEIDEKTKVPLEFSPKTFTLHSNPIYIKFKKLE